METGMHLHFSGETGFASRTRGSQDSTPDPLGPETRNCDGAGPSPRPQPATTPTDPPAMLPRPDRIGTEPSTISAFEENSGTAACLTGQRRPHETPAGSEALSTRALARGAWRARVLKEARRLLAAGLSQQAIARMVGTSSPTLSRLLHSHARLADHELTAEACSTEPAHRPRSPFADLLRVPEILTELNRLYAATIGASGEPAMRGRRTGSVALALKRLGDFPAVPAHLAAQLRAGSKPQPLVDHLKKKWTPEIEAKLRGQKNYNSATISGRRDLVEELMDGTRVPLKPGRVWVLDDMSSNIPFWFEASADGAPTSLSPMIRRHGCALGRQGLYAWDWASGAWLGVELVGRLRDAYQASDILRFLRKLITRYGIPDKIVLERGVWKSHCISGWTADDDGLLLETEDAWEIPDMRGDETARITDGIRALGCEIIHAYTPRGKPIEGAFNYHQRLVPTFLKTGEAVNIGRHAGEFEWAARQMRRAGAGVAHARDLGFIHIDRLADVAWEAMVWEGWHNKERRNGKPLELLTSFLNASPLPQPSARDLAVFLPEKKHRVYTGGSLRVETAGITHEFLNPEIFPQLPAGTHLDFAFDPAEPQLGAAVYDSRGFLCWADYLPAGPVISARERGDDAGPQLLKRYKLAHRTAARLLDLTTLRTVRVTESRSLEPVSPRAVETGHRERAATPATLNHRRIRDALISLPD